MQKSRYIVWNCNTVYCSYELIVCLTMLVILNGMSYHGITYKWTNVAPFIKESNYAWKEANLLHVTHYFLRNVVITKLIKHSPYHVMWRFIALFTRVHQWTLSLASISLQDPVFILSLHLCLRITSGLFHLHFLWLLSRKIITGNTSLNPAKVMGIFFSTKKLCYVFTSIS